MRKDEALIKKAETRAYKSFQELKNTKPVPTPRSLSEIKEKRIAEKALERYAPVTGYPDLDRLVKGFIPGHLYTLTGETNVGKTSVACNFAVNVAKQGKRVLYIALEPDNTVIDYIASVFHSKRFEELTEDDLSLDGMSIDVLGKDDVDSAETMVNVIQNLERYDLVIIDHIGYFITSENGWLQQQSNAIKQMVSIAKKKSCAVMIIAHLRKRAKNEKRGYTPSADDISGSGAFKQDSTDVLIVTRNMKSDDKDEIEYSDGGRIVVTKTKSGPNGQVNILFSTRSAKITSEEESYYGNSADYGKQKAEEPVKVLEDVSGEVQDIFGD